MNETPTETTETTETFDRRNAIHNAFHPEIYEHVNWAFKLNADRVDITEAHIHRSIVKNPVLVALATLSDEHLGEWAWGVVRLKNLINPGPLETFYKTDEEMSSVTAIDADGNAEGMYLFSKGVREWQAAYACSLGEPVNPVTLRIHEERRYITLETEGLLPF